VEKLLRCECGFEVCAEEEAELVAGVQRHAHEAHGMQLSPEEALQLASRAIERRDPSCTSSEVALGPQVWPRRLPH
jgi:predicted small metal-binding protein